MSRFFHITDFFNDVIAPRRAIDTLLALPEHLPQREMEHRPLHAPAYAVAMCCARLAPV